MPCDAGTIQAAIDSAAAGDTVLVPPGTWRERIAMKSGVTVRGEDEQDPDQLLRRADEALYAAKQGIFCFAVSG